MADPNTQIDWWIAQAWQEAQGGAESDALVVWLHENGLTAISSYTILQAALSCTPDEAKQMVFGHPIWAGEDTDTDVANLDYTNETLEPEPEPDPSFELDDWADHLEEDGPVYGEEGYEPDPDAGVSLPAKTSAEPALNAYNEPGAPEQPGVSGPAGEIEEEPFEPFEADSQPSPEPESAPMEAMPPAPEPMQEPAQAFEPDMSPVPEPALDSAESFDAPMSPAPEPEPMPLAAEAVAEPAWEAPPAPAPEPELPPAPALETPRPAPAPVPPPILRTPPSTPAERAAVFAGAFGKKPAAAAPPASATAEAPSTPPGAVPPSTDMGPAAEAETSPAQSETQQPHPAMATVPVPPPLVYEPLPELEIPQPAVATEPLFSTPHDAPQPAEPLFSPSEFLQPTTSEADDELRETELPAAAMNGYDEQAGSEMGAAGEEETPETVSDPALAMPADGEEEIAENVSDPVLEMPADDPEDIQESVVDDIPDDLPPGIRAAMEAGGIDAPGGMDELQEEVEADHSAIDREQELPPRDEDEDEETEAGTEEDNYPSDDDSADDAHRPGKKILLDPSAKELDAGHPEEMPIGDETEDMSAVARKLGISFREGDPAEIGVDPEMVRAAKELGISFREGDDAQEPEFDETALAAKKLGISFRDGDLTSSKPPKPLIVKYLPLILVIIAIFFLMLLGATFAGDAISWLRNSGWGG